MEHYIIPYNFEATGEVALEYALALVSDSNAKISLLYIAKDEAEKHNAETRFKSITYPSRVVVGNLLEVLSMEAQKMNGTALVMAIKNESGLQKMFGSTAIKVITDSNIPFLIVQENKDSNHRIKKIALTIDTREESTKVLNAAIQFCELFHAEIIIVGGKQNDSNLRQKFEDSLKKMSDLLDTTGVKYSSVQLDSNNFENNLLEFSQKEHVDLLAVTYYKDNSSLFSSSFVQRLLENKEGLPVLTIGGREIPAFQRVFNNMVCPVSIAKIDSNISRLTIFINVLLMGIFLFMYEPVFAYIVSADYFIRAFVSGKFSPIRFIAEQIIKALNLKPKRINLAPKIFASRLGFLCAAAAVVFFHLDNYWASLISMGMLAVLSFMDSVMNFCVGCLIYNYLVYPVFKFKNR